MRSTTFPGQLMISAAALLAADAAPSSGESNSTPGGAPAGDAAQASAPAPDKRYRAQAELRPKQEVSAEQPKTIFLVVTDTDYKSAWETARQVTREGSDEATEQGITFEFEGVKLDDGATGPMPDGFKMRPGRYTIQDVTSLQERGKKAEPVSIQDLEATLAERGVKVPATVQALIDELKADPSKAVAAKAAAPEESGKQTAAG